MRPNFYRLLIALLTGAVLIACNQQHGECRKCMEDELTVSARFACTMSLKDQGHADSDADWTAALDGCVKKGIAAALENENTRRDMKERCAASGRCRK